MNYEDEDGDILIVVILRGTNRLWIYAYIVCKVANAYVIPKGHSMKKYFIDAMEKVSLPNIPADQILAFRNDIIEEMLRLGASENDYRLISEPMIVNAITRNIKPGEVAWAILQ